MTEDEWDACADPRLMLAFVRGKGTFSERKARLFAAACCRRIWPSMTGVSCRRAIEVAERFVDGQASVEDLWAAHEAARIEGDLALEAVWQGRGDDFTAFRLGHETCQSTYAAAGWACWHHFPRQMWLSTRDVFDAMNASVREARSVAAKAGAGAAQAPESHAQAALLRDSWGNPLRPPPRIGSAWLAWNDGMVPKMAQSIYDDYAFDRLPLLADALEDAGYDNTDILWHCRGPGPHVRGCWVVDLLLGKE